MSELLGFTEELVVKLLGHAEGCKLLTLSDLWWLLDLVVERRSRWVAIFLLNDLFGKFNAGLAFGNFFGLSSALDLVAVLGHMCSEALGLSWRLRSLRARALGGDLTALSLLH